MRTPTPSNNMARRAIALLHKLRRGLPAYVVFGDTRSEQLRERLYHDAIGYTIVTNQRRSIGRPATDQSVLPGAAANLRSTNPDVRASAEDAQTAEAGFRLTDGPKPRTSRSNLAPGASPRTTQRPPTLGSSSIGINAPSIRRASLGRCPGPRPARRMASSSRGCVGC